MLDAVGKLTEIGIYNVVIVLLIVIMFLPVLVDSWKKFITTITHHEKIEAEQQAQIDDIDEKLEDYKKEILCKQETYHQQSIDIRNGLADNQKKLENSQQELHNSISLLTKKLENYIESDRKKNIASLRYELYGMHKEFMQQKYVTTEGLKTFMELASIYEENGGNDILHDRLKPDVLKLQIRYSEDLL